MLKPSFEMGRPFSKPIRAAVCDGRSPPFSTGKLRAEPTRADSRPVTSQPVPYGCLVPQQNPLDNSGSVETKTRVGGEGLGT